MKKCLYSTLILPMLCSLVFTACTSSSTGRNTKATSSDQGVSSDTLVINDTSNIIYDDNGIQTNLLEVYRNESQMVFQISITNNNDEDIFWGISSFTVDSINVDAAETCEVCSHETIENDFCFCMEELQKHGTTDIHEIIIHMHSEIINQEQDPDADEVQTTDYRESDVSVFFEDGGSFVTGTPSDSTQSEYEETELYEETEHYDETELYDENELYMQNEETIDTLEEDSDITDDLEFIPDETYPIYYSEDFKEDSGLCVTVKVVSFSHDNNLGLLTMEMANVGTVPVDHWFVPGFTINGCNVECISYNYYDNQPVEIGECNEEEFYFDMSELKKYNIEQINSLVVNIEYNYMISNIESEQRTFVEYEYAHALSFTLDPVGSYDPSVFSTAQLIFLEEFPLIYEEEGVSVYYSGIYEEDGYSHMRLFYCNDTDELIVFSGSSDNSISITGLDSSLLKADSFFVYPHSCSCSDIIYEGSKETMTGLPKDSIVNVSLICYHDWYGAESCPDLNYSFKIGMTNH